MLKVKVPCHSFVVGLPDGGFGLLYIVRESPPVAMDLLLRILRKCHRKITKDDASIHRQEVAETDERILMMNEKARSWAFSYSILIAGIVVIVLSLLGKHEAAQPFAWYVCGQICLYWVCWLILRKKY